MAILRTSALVAAAAAVLGVLAPGAAHAASSSCSVNGAYPWLPNTCYTQSVWARARAHSIDIYVGPYGGCSMDYKVRDIANNAVVHSGRTSRDYSTTLYNVYSAYRLEVTKIGRGCGGDAIIDNN